MPSSALQEYLTSYHGINDWHLNAFRLISERFTPTRVLYPGSWNHVTPSLVFPYVIYIDLSARIERQFRDPALIQYIHDHAEYLETPQLVFHHTDYRSNPKLHTQSFNLVLSLSAGLISRDCQQYIAPQGYLLANNSHHDASLAYVDPIFALVGVFPNAVHYIDDSTTIHRYFHTTKNVPVTQDMVFDNLQRPPSKARYKLKYKAALYLFQIKHQQITRA
jgi:hypothetical protein